VLAEMSLMPMAVVVVFLYDPRQPLGFLLLASTFLVINFVYNRLSRAGRKLRKRVSELEALNVTSRRLAASIQLHALVEAVARETVNAIDDAEGLVLVHRPPGAEGDEFNVDLFDRRSNDFERLEMSEVAGLLGRVIEHNAALSVYDLQESEHTGGVLAERGVRACIGVPLVIYGNVAGVLGVHSSEPGVFDEDDLFLLESIGAQVAVGLQNAHLYELAMVDGLTKLFVRRYFDARLDEEILRAHRFDTVFSVVMMDIDNFKVLNDTHGHQTGDRVLRAIADVVRSEMRGVDTAARYGGEEVSMILPRTDMVSAYNLAERIRELITELELTSADGEPIEVTSSFGISAFPESGASDGEELVRLADRALYRAKRTGKNRVELYWAAGAEGEAGASVRPVK
jgi:diguanylate cyclase (GGDEF)-like protein